MSARRKFAVLAVAASLGACGGARVGIEGYENFAASARLETLASAAPYADFARCFEHRARLLPFSQLYYFGAQNEAVYKLQGYGWWFETIRFAPTPTGSVAEIRLAANFDAKWEAGFRKDRYAALVDCTRNPA